MSTEGMQSCRVKFVCDFRGMVWFYLSEYSGEEEITLQKAVVAITL